MEPIERPGPAYEFPRLRLIGFALSVLFARRRSFAKDAQVVMRANPYSRRIEGLEHIPDGPFILAVNHYNRQGLRPYHCAMVIAAALADWRPARAEIRWAFASELYGQHFGPLPIPVPLIRWVFRRFARTYDLVTMPRREERALGRAQALRHLVEALRRAPVGLTPEAAGSGTLVEPRHGVGLFFILLSRGGCPVLPAGIWEENSSLVVRFGEPFHLSVDPLLSREEQDRAGRDEVMIAIGKLLPRPSWGAYEQRIADALTDASEETRR